MEGIPVFLYPTKEDAAEGTNQIAVRTSNAEGTASFSNIDCGEVYIKVVTLENGTFITQEILSENASAHWYEARFVGNYYFDNCDTPSNQRHISLEKPVVGQRSIYRGHHGIGHISFTPQEYLDMELEVKIIDQLSENSFLVQEKIDTIVPGFYGFFFSGVFESIVQNIWTVENDGITVSQYANQPYYSFVWNITIESLNTNEFEYHFPFEVETDFHLDMSNDTAISIGGLPSYDGTVEDYILFDSLYTDLIFESRSFTSADGPAKVRVYNRQDGLVRVMEFFHGMSQNTSGFDLVLE